MQTVRSGVTSEVVGLANGELTIDVSYGAPGDDGSVIGEDGSVNIDGSRHVCGTVREDGAAYVVGVVGELHAFYGRRASIDRDSFGEGKLSTDDL